MASRMASVCSSDLFIDTWKQQQDADIMVSALSFKGDKKPKKRKRVDADEKFGPEGSTSKALVKAEESQSVDDDSWVTAEATGDVVGPIVLVLPSEPPTCVACDATGKVFASPLENIINDDPSTAEPHDVRQVWVANRVAGTETFSFKGHQGKYVVSIRNWQAEN